MDWVGEIHEAKKTSRPSEWYHQILVVGGYRVMREDCLVLTLTLSEKTISCQSERDHVISDERRMV